MPRGKKKVVNIAEKIEAVKAEIESLSTQLKEVTVQSTPNNTATAFPRKAATMASKEETP